MKDFSQYDFYELLGIEHSAGFSEIKKAYYKKVKDCHPDLYGGSHEKEEEFKQIVLAFDILSDPDKRSIYDLQKFKDNNKEQKIPGFEPSYSSIMDSDADDTLEELIVGNEVPKNTTLATLFLDLEKTEIFINFREGKYLFRKKEYKNAFQYFLKLVDIAPNNILYRYFLAKTYACMGNFSLAAKHYSEAIKIGNQRIPPQKLVKIHKELNFVREKSNPLLKKIFSLLGAKKNTNAFIDTESEMIDEMNKAIKNINIEIEHKKQEKEREKKMLQ